jgi:hypothetical protein
MASIITSFVFVILVLPSCPFLFHNRSSMIIGGCASVYRLACGNCNMHKRAALQKMAEWRDGAVNRSKKRAD